MNWAGWMLLSLGCVEFTRLSYRLLELLNGERKHGRKHNQIRLP